MRYANKPEVMHQLEEGGMIEAHDGHYYLVMPTDCARIRYSLWRSLHNSGVIRKLRQEKRPPSVLPFFLYGLK